MKTLVLFASLFIHASFAVAQNNVPVVRTLDHRLQQETRSLNPEYLVFLPKSDSSTNMPLLIYLHGAGGVGNDINIITREPMRVWEGIRKFNKGPCVVVAPQCLREPSIGVDSGWLPGDLNSLLQDLKANLPVDSNRVYLTGNSMGGYGTWAWGAHNPEHFAAIAPVVGGIGPGGPKDVTPDLDKWAANLAKIPVYAFAGEKDRIVPAERSERMITAIREAGGKDARLKIYPDEGHGAGQVVFSTPEFYDWMFSKRSAQTDN
jgi:predicted peptidase